jgi:hypothetical protein
LTVQRLSPPQRLLKNMKFEGIEIALEGIWYEDNAISIPSNFIFFKSLCGGERFKGRLIKPQSIRYGQCPMAKTVASLACQCCM